MILSMSFNTGSETQNFVQKNDILPLYILYGNDTLNDIGDPKVIQQGNRDLFSLWEDTFSSLFMNYKTESEKDKKEDIDEIYRERYKEARIDEELLMFE